MLQDKPLWDSVFQQYITVDSQGVKIEACHLTSFEA